MKLKLKLNYSYMYYSLIVLALLIDVLFLGFIKENYFLFSLYVIINILIISIYFLKCSVTDSIIFSILFMLFYSWFIDIFIHYLGKKIILEAEFLFIVPLLLSCLKIKGKKIDFFLSFCVFYLPISFLIMIFNGKVDIINYLRFSVNICAFICYYYLFQNITINRKLKKLYTFVFVICFFTTILQTAVGFNMDTRNGAFSVFGFGAYTIFIMIYISYKTSRFISKKEGFFSFCFAIVIATIIYICTESKGALIIMYINIGLMSLLRKGISKRKILLISLGILSLPIAYDLLIKFNPKFSYLTNLESIIRYHFGNNNWKYEYGRFEAIVNVFSEQDWPTRLFGIGLGSSTPLYTVFYNELGRIPFFPYYIKQYGYYYGYQHTSISTLLLDGGIFLAIVIVIMLLKKFYMTAKEVYLKNKNIVYSLQFGVMVYLLYYFSYANILKDFRAMAITAIVFAMKKIDE